MKLGRRVTVAAMTALLAVAMAACSATGGKKAADKASQGTNAGAGVANTPRLRIAMVTHASPGDTFWDLVLAGARVAAHKDNVQLIYSNNPDQNQQATLVQTAIDSKVNGIAVTMAYPAAIAPKIKEASGKGIPVVVFNSGEQNWKGTGALEYFGQDETVAGIAAGKRLASGGAKHVLCVIHEQGNIGLEQRCAGVKQGFTGTTTELNVDGTNSSGMLSAITAQLQRDPSIDAVMTLGAPIAQVAVQAVQQAHSSAKIYTFDTNAALVKDIQNGSVQWAIDQQPYLQGYEAVDSLWLYLTNGDVLGGGNPVLTGPSFVDKSNIAAIAKYAENGTR
jgi:simple sugar transport system substrate-binding protein